MKTIKLTGVIFWIGLFLAKSVPVWSQCDPTPGDFERNIVFSKDALFDAGSYTLIKTSERLEVKENNEVIYSHSIASDRIVSYHFYGPESQYLLIQELASGIVMEDFTLFLINLDVADGPREFLLSSGSFQTSLNPEMKVQTAIGNAQAALYYYVVNDADQIGRIVEPTFFCCETGEIICRSYGYFQPSSPLIAVATENELKLEGLSVNYVCNLPGTDTETIHVEPSIIDFGQVLAGTGTIVKLFTINNLINSPVNFSIAINETGSVFTIQPLTGDIPAKGSRAIQVIFTPPASGVHTFSNQLSITNNVDQGTKYVILTAQTVASLPSWPYGSRLNASDVEANSVKLSWTNAINHASYRIWQKQPENKLIATLDGDSLSCKVTGLTGNTFYKFKVEAGDDIGNWTTNGPEKSITTLDNEAPDWPPESQLSVRDLTSYGFTLYWSEAQDENEIVYYKLYWIKGTESNLIGYVQGGDFSYTLSCLEPNTTFKIKIEAEDGYYNESSTGPYVEVTTLPDENGCEENLRRISVSSGGGQAESIIIAGLWDSGHADSDKPAINADGRYIAFESCAGNLVPGDNNSVLSEVYSPGNWWAVFLDDVFVHDQLTKQTERVSISSSGEETALGTSSYDPSIDASGRYVAFSSSGTNLVGNDHNEKVDIFLHDRKTKQTTRISYGPNGNEGNDHSGLATISADANFVLFHSKASNFTSGNVGQLWQLYLYNRQTGGVELITKGIDGLAGNGNSWGGNISADNRYIAFASNATNLLIEEDRNGVADVFCYDRLTGTLQRINKGLNGSEANGGSVIEDTQTQIIANRIGISADGNFIVYDSYASNLVPNDNNNSRDAFLYNRFNNNTEAISVDMNGIPVGNSKYPFISGNGRLVTFATWSMELWPGAPTSGYHVYVRDRLTGTNQMFGGCSCGNHFTPENWASNWPSISKNGRYIAFRSFSNNLIPNSEDTNDADDIFLYKVPYNETDNDDDGVADVQEKGPYGTNNSYDGNSDGKPDGEQRNVASLPAHFANGYVTFAVEEPAYFAEMKSRDTLVPEGLLFQYNLFSFKLVTADAGIEVHLKLPPGIIPEKMYQFGSTPDVAQPHWYEFQYDGETGAEITGNMVTLHYRDGKRGDDNGAENGIIEVSAIGPVWLMAKPSIVIQPEKIDFGEVQAGSAVTANVVIYNAGSSILHVDNIRTLSEFFEVSPEACTLLPGTSDTVIISFSPPVNASDAIVNADLQISHNDPDKPELIIPITAVIKKNEPVIAIQPSYLKFGKVKIYKKSEKLLRITNTGSAILAITGFNIRQSANAFKIKQTTRIIRIEPGESKDVTVTFNPTRLGNYEATLTVSSNAANEIPAVKLWGNCVWWFAW